MDRKCRCAASDLSSTAPKHIVHFIREEIACVFGEHDRSRLRLWWAALEIFRFTAPRAVQPSVCIPKRSVTGRFSTVARSSRAISRDGAKQRQSEDSGGMDIGR